MQFKRLPLILAMLCLGSIGAEAQKVSTMQPASSPLSGAELFYCVQGGQSRKCTAGQIGGLGNFTGLPAANSNSALQALGTTSGPAIIRAGFTAPGDSAAIMYNASSTPCSLNAGAGDNGSQVKSADGKCWIANLNGVKVTPKVWGAKGDGVTDDTTAVQAAISAMYGNTLYCGPNIYKVGALTAANSINIICDGREVSGFRAKDISGYTLITLNGNGSLLAHAYFDMGTAGTQPIGSLAILISASNPTVEDVFIDHPCNGISVNGTVPHVKGAVVINHHGAGCAGITVGNNGGVFDFDLDTILVNTCYNKFSGNCGTDSPDADILIVEAGGGIIHGLTDLIHSNYPLKIFPGLNQSVSSVNVIGGYSDSADITPCYINTGDATASIQTMSFDNWWCASANLGSGTGLDGEQIKNDAGGQVAGVHHVNTRFVNNAINGAHVYPGAAHQRATFTGSISGTTMTVSAMLTGSSIVPGDSIGGAGVSANTYVLAPTGSTTGGVGTYLIAPSQIVASETLTGTQAVTVTGVTYSASQLCGNSTSGDQVGSGIVLESGPTVNQPLVVSITGSQLGSYCDFSVVNGSAAVRPLGSGNTRQFTGVYLSAPGYVSFGLTGNDLTGNAGGTINTNPVGFSQMSLNRGIDDAASGTITAAATITLQWYPQEFLTGTTPITTMNGYWYGRIVTLVSASATPLATGGGGPGAICNAVTMTPNVPVIATYNAGNTCWYVK